MITGGFPAEFGNRFGGILDVVTRSGFDANLFRRERRGLGLQVNVENPGKRVFQIAKESEFTPIQYSPPRLISGSVRLRF